jgi:hypothetical protein
MDPKDLRLLIENALKQCCWDDGDEERRRETVEKLREDLKLRIDELTKFWDTAS